MGDEIEGAMQHAPHPTRHAMACPSAVPSPSVPSPSTMTTPLLAPQTANTILYCAGWAETVAFYRDTLGFSVTFANDWFVEFALTDTARLSIADARRATVPSGGAGITLTLQVADADAAHAACAAAGLSPTPCRRHAWGARAFFLRDPAGHRLEVWSAPRAELG